MPGTSGIPAREQQALQTATDGLYAAFASYPLRETIKGCLHCLQQIDMERLHTVPLRSLTRDDLSEFLGDNAGQTVGDALDLKHFLPRLLELMAQPDTSDDYLILPPEMLGSAVSRHGYDTWPQHEQQALQVFCLAWWESVLATLPQQPVNLDDRVDTLLCAVSQFTDDLAPYLQTWRSLRSGTALAQLGVFIAYHLIDTNAGRWRNPWWQGRERQWQQVEAWVCDPATASWVQEAWERNNARKRQEPSPGADQFYHRLLDWLASQANRE